MENCHYLACPCCLRPVETRREFMSTSLICYFLENKHKKTFIKFCQICQRKEIGFLRFLINFLLLLSLTAKFLSNIQFSVLIKLLHTGKLSQTFSRQILDPGHNLLTLYFHEMDSENISSWIIDILNNKQVYLTLY